MDKDRITKMEEYFDLTNNNIKNLRKSINNFKKKQYMK